MKIKHIPVFLTLLLLAPTLLHAETKYIDGFTKSAVGSFPKGWRARPGQGGTAEEVYKIAEENGNKYLAADDQKVASVQIFKMAHWDIDKYPIFKWRWRAKILPAGANETIPSKNDSACGIYISFGLLRGKALKYVWSTTAAPGTYHKKNDKMYIIVKRKGSPGSWQYETANIAEDAKKVFGKVPDRTLSGIAILTDGNATNTPAACDYDSIGYGTAE